VRPARLEVLASRRADASSCCSCVRYLLRMALRPLARPRAPCQARASRRATRDARWCAGARSRVRRAEGDARCAWSRGSLEQTLNDQARSPCRRTSIALRAADRERYQTVFARVDGAVAAPTAGLHFSPECWLARGEGRRQRPGAASRWTGHVPPVTADDPSRHVMDEEYSRWRRPRPNAPRRRGAAGRIVAVGTTAVRALEIAPATRTGDCCALRAVGRGSSSCRPIGSRRWMRFSRTFTCRAPRCCSGRRIRRRGPAAPRLRHAVSERYRFYSYGDAMLIVWEF
jgi:hypothetical protein